MTGHGNGIITLSLVEADDAMREQLRVAMGEPYRTLLGHFRHECGHFYWDKLVRDGGKIDSCRAVFGDESEDYEDALKRHYANGAPPPWQQEFVSSYATSHPWEDFAEAFPRCFALKSISIRIAVEISIKLQMSGFRSPLR